MSNQPSAGELTKEEVAKWSNRDLAVAVVAAAIGSGDIEVARVLREAAERLRKCSSSSSGGDAR